jgi:membrane protease YdiL (CAAX protease family)
LDNTEAAAREPEPLTIAELKRETIWAALGVLIILGAIKHLAKVVPIFAEHGFTIAAAFQLYVPLYLIGRRGITKEGLGLTLAKWKTDALLVLIWATIVTIPFAIGHHYWQTIGFNRTFHWRAPTDLLETVLIQVLVVGLAEELYFRGYLQARLELIFPAKSRLFGAPFGPSIVIASAVFAMAHFIGEYNFARLGPFFPGLAFGWLRSKSGTIVGAIVFHAYCNLLGDVLFNFYRP